MDKMFKTETTYTIRYTRNGRTFTKTYVNQEWIDTGWARVQELRAKGIEVTVVKEA